MDNLCHTLTGAALAEAGLKQRTRYGSAALMIAANLPDIDVLAFLSDTPAVALRRGWTHGVLAQALLPAVLAGVFVAIDRWRRAGTADAPPFQPWTLLALAYAGVLSHVAMDWLNTYGVRLLMPFSNTWFYGDSVFIVDPWLWIMLAGGVVLARRRRRAGAAAAALILAGAYIAMMIASGVAARERVAAAWTDAKGTAPGALMVGPVPMNPLRKTVIIDAGSHYERGTFAWWPIEVRFDPRSLEKNDRHPAVLRAAASNPDFQAVLRWARFPYYTLEPVPTGTRVSLADVRFRSQRLLEVSTIVPDDR